MKTINNLCLFISLFIDIASVEGGSYFDQFIDPTDGRLDVSQWLAGQTGILLTPITISDPAVGYGGGLVVAFFHDSEDEAPQTDDVNEILSR